MSCRLATRILDRCRQNVASRAPLTSHTRHRSRPPLAIASHYSTTGAQVIAHIRQLPTTAPSRPHKGEKTDGYVHYPTKRPPRRTVIVREFDPERTTLQDLQELLEPYGEIRQMNMHGRNVCYVEYQTLAAAKSLIWKHRVHAIQLHGEPLFINYAVDIVDVGTPSHLVWVTGLDMSTRPDLGELKGAFSRFGEVENIILNRKGLGTCTVRFASEESAIAAINAHREKRMHYRGLALQLRYGKPPAPSSRSPNPSLHIMGFVGTPERLLSYIPGQADSIEDLYMSHPKGDSLERHDVFVRFDSTKIATDAMSVLNRQLGLAAQYAWPKKPPGFNPNVHAL